MQTGLAITPQPPYYAVIFSSQRSALEPQAYADMAARMVELAQQQTGFLGAESARDADGFGITVSYWQDEASITAWKAHAEHRLAQDKGFSGWYTCFATRVAKVERQHLFEQDR